MMPVKNLAGMVLRNTWRSPRHFILSAFGIMIGIGAFVLFLALTQKAGAVIEAVFPVEEVEVVARRVSAAESMLGAGKKLDDGVVAMLRAQPDVKSAVPRMALAFPAAGRGDFEGKDLRFEIGGFADGVDPSFVLDGSYVQQDNESQVAAHKRITELFKDWDAEKNDPNRVKCEPPPRDPDEKDDLIQSPRKKPEDAGGSAGWGTPAPTPPAPPPDPGSGSAGSGSGSAGSGSAGSAAGAGSGSGSAVVIAKKEKPPEYFNPCPNPDRYYCDDTEKICKHRVPIVLSTTVVELYNNQFAKVHKMPVADKDLVNFLIQNRGLSAMRFSVGLGSTTIAGGSRKVQAKPRRVEAVVIGVSPRAMRVGMTVPIDYIKRWNREFLGEEAATSYSSIITTVKDRSRLAPFIEWLKKDAEKGGAGLSHEDNLGEKFASVVEVVRLLFLIISIAILVIAVINIGHNFFVQVSERRREIGIMRAVGASQSDVMLVILGEAAVIGIIGGLVGIGVAFLIGSAWNWYAETGVAAFPHKPESWFDFKPWIWGSALVFSTLFCVLGGLLPARRAAKMEPAQALAAQ
jgi:hypothetical protein